MRMTPAFSNAAFSVSTDNMNATDRASIVGGVILCQSESTHQIVMSFLPPVKGCLLKTRLANGGLTSTPGLPPG